MEKEILSFWFPNEDKIPKFWFNETQEFDNLIKEKYHELLIAAENHTLNNWKATPEGHLALIIILDQFSRHIYRDTPEQFKNDIIAYYNAKEFILEKKDKNLTILQRIMLLMPFRHQANLKDYEFVINYMKDYSGHLVDKFLMQTLRRYNTLKDTGELPDRPIINIFSQDYSNILENKWEVTIRPYFVYENEICNVLQKFIKKNIKSDEPHTITVSLSGGVDSMVILYILKSFAIPNLIINAVHLDYGNRVESSFEAEFLMKWCRFINVELYYKYIYEAQRIRGNEREKYEDMTTEIRFNLYKKVITKNHIGVVLGHHLGDIQENVFFNLVRGRSLIDLTVMKESSVIDGVTILRPLVGHPKDLIFDYAHNSNIPYFKNTTPSWSNRGKWREKLLPSLIDTFGIGILKNLTKVSHESDDLKELVINDIVKPYMKLVKINGNIYEYPICRDKPLSFWKYVLLYFCVEHNISIVSGRTLEIVYYNISNNKKIKIICSDKMTICIGESLQIVIKN